MKKHFWAISLAFFAAVLGVAVASATGDGDESADDTADNVFLGEQDLAERMEIWRNQFRRMTPGDMPLVQDVGTWPAAWEEFSHAWAVAPVERDLATWLVPVTAARSGALTVLRDANGTVLWSGATDFAKDESASVTLTGLLVDEEEWPLYEAAREEVERRYAEAFSPVYPGGMRGTNGPYTNGLRFTDISVDTNGDYRLDFAWETNGDVQVFCRAMHYECWTNFGVVSTNDENQVVTNDVVNWRQVPGEKFMGIPDYWESLGVTTVTNGEGSFTDTNHANPLFARVRFYAAAQYADSDNDGITDGEEWLWGISSTTDDSDCDGVPDYLERTVYHTDPYNPDTDGDGWTDGEEVNTEHTDPLDRLSATRLARGVLVHGVKYSGDETNQWVQLHCSGSRRVDVSGFRVQAAGTSWQTVATLPADTWMTPGHFLLIGDEGVTNADLTAALGLAGSELGQPTAGVRLMAPAGSTNDPVDTMLYARNNIFNENMLDITGWSTPTTNLWAAPAWHLERWQLGLDSGRDNDWRYAPDVDGDVHNSETILDSDGDDLIDETEYIDGLDPLSPDMDGDGLLDGFERMVNLDPEEPDSDFDGTLDGDELDPDTGQPYVKTQEAQGLTVHPSDGWVQGMDIGLSNSVVFTVTDIAGFAALGTIWEGGNVPESYTVDVAGAYAYAQWERQPKYGHKVVNIFAVPNGTNAIVITATDGGPNPRVTNSNDFGADIRAAFRAMKLDVEAGGVDETHEEDPGVFLLDRTIHTNAPRTACHLSIDPHMPKMTPPFPGTLSLEWNDMAIQVYPEDQPEDGTPLTDLVVPLDGFISTNVWLEAIAPSNTTLQWEWNGYTNGMDWATLNGVKLSLIEVDFAGVKCHTIKKDDGTEDYIAPHWQDNSSPSDGDADDTGDIKWPVCFTRNTKMSASVYWMLEPLSPSWSIKVKGNGLENLDFPVTNATVEANVNLVYVSDWECENPFTNAVAYYPSMGIGWSFSMDDGATWLNGGRSDNPVYVTLGDPLTADLYQTVVHIGCVNAAGKTTEGETTDAIYSEFTDLEVRRVSDNMQMTYWANRQPGGPETTNLLASADGNGNCQAWSAFLRDCFMVQGIQSHRIRAWPVNPLDASILVKNWLFSATPSGNGRFPYEVGVEATISPGIPAQGNASPPEAFTGHWITESCGYYFDPSYGTPKVGGANKGKVYEDSSLDGYADANFEWCRKNDVSPGSNSEMKYETDD